MSLPVSIIIPTFNEGRYLPQLLKSIKAQTQTPKEVIVADANSSDGTWKIAKKFNARVVEGGMPGVGRNNGAKTATQPFLLFLDADVVLPPKFLELTIKEMIERELDIASCFVIPRSTIRIDRILHTLVNQYMKFAQNFQPVVPGFCIFIKRSLHEKIGGFDESIILAEDQDYFRRAKKLNRFAYLKSSKIPVSVRRLSKEGRIRTSLKYIAMHFYVIFFGRIRKNIFKYKFGQF